MDDQKRVTLTKRIHLDLALALLGDVQREATRAQLDLAVAIVDPSGVPVLTARTGDANFAALDIAVDKAYTAVAWKAPTSMWKELTAPGAPGWGMASSLSGRAVVFAGGLPLWDSEGDFLGGIGVSGALPDQDEAVALAAVSAHELVSQPLSPS